MTQPVGTFLTGVLYIDGVPVTYCVHECATHRCAKPCGRIDSHPADDTSHVCNECAQVLYRMPR